MYRSKASPTKYQWAGALRKRKTEAEKALQRELNRTAYRWQSQSLMLGWILDFYCARFRVAVEVDGSSHDGKKQADEHRDAVLKNRLGILTLRFSNESVLLDPVKVADQIVRFCESLPAYATWNQGRTKKR